MFYKLISRLGVIENTFLKNLGWLGASEVIVRVTRLLAAVVLARILGPLEFGIAALVLTVNELIRVFSRNGVGAKIVQCDENQLEQICNTAYQLNFIFCFILFVLQTLLAYPIADWYNAPTLVPMIQVLALTYLLMPFGMVQAALVLRQQRLKSVALIDGGQVAVDNVLTTILAILGFGAWSIVLPKFLTSPIWVLGYRRAQPWAPTYSKNRLTRWKDVIDFGRYYLGIEVLKTARLNLDNIIIGRVLGVEALGIYYFARNAGLGFSLTLINAINSALYPNLCEVNDNIKKLYKRFNDNLKKIALIACPLLIAQAGLAFWYVPIVFGEKWTTAIPLMAVLCLSAIPRPFGESASALMLATGKIKIDFIWNGLFTALFVMTVFFVSMFSPSESSLISIAVGILIIYSISNPLYLFYAWQNVFKSSNKLPDHNVNSKST